MEPLNRSHAYVVATPEPPLRVAFFVVVIGRAVVPGGRGTGGLGVVAIEVAQRLLWRRKGVAAALLAAGLRTAGLSSAGLCVAAWRAAGSRWLHCDQHDCGRPHCDALGCPYPAGSRSPRGLRSGRSRLTAAEMPVTAAVNNRKQRHFAQKAAWLWTEAEKKHEEASLFQWRRLGAALLEDSAG
jgi:hypothetical protein